MPHTDDLDGNLISDGTWSYSWDAENRLKQAVRVDLTQRLTFTYDYILTCAKLEGRPPCRPEPVRPSWCTKRTGQPFDRLRLQTESPSLQE